MIEPNKVFEFNVQEMEKINPEDELACSLNWEVPNELPYFAGHFPGNPVLPAVAVIDASLELLRRILDKPSVELKSIHSAKFVSLISPGMPVHISLRSHTSTVSGKSWNVVWNTPNGETSRLLAELSFSV
jgi:3-hydroxymyristoyl/3-hydroxydecanoyl-(acyl carrier protein) dehydratase